MQQVDKKTSFGAISTLCSMNVGGTYLLAGTTQGQVNLYHIDLDTGKLRNMAKTNFFLGPVNQIIFTSSSDIGVLMDTGLLFIEAVQDSLTNTWALIRKNKQEIYCSRTQSTLMIEYEPQKFLLASLHASHFVLLNRNFGKPIDPPGSEYDVIVDDTTGGNVKQGYHDLQILKGFDPQEYPYCIAKGYYGLILIDLKLRVSLPLLKLEPMQLNMRGSRMIQLGISDYAIYPGEVKVALARGDQQSTNYIQDQKYLAKRLKTVRLIFSRWHDGKTHLEEFDLKWEFQRMLHLRASPELNVQR